MCVKSLRGTSDARPIFATDDVDVRLVGVEYVVGTSNDGSTPLSSGTVTVSGGSFDSRAGALVLAALAMDSTCSTSAWDSSGTSAAAALAPALLAAVGMYV